MKEHISLIVLIGYNIAGSLFGAARHVYTTGHRPASGTLSDDATGIHGISGVDLSDDRNLVGMAHHFFVGKVISQGEPRRIDDMFTLDEYKVSVLLNIKGNLEG